MISTAEYLSPLGEILLAEKDGNLVGLWFAGQKYFPVFREDAVLNRNTDTIARVEDWLNRYFRGKAPSPSELPLAPGGSAFRQEVWDILREIPYGSVITYGAIAERIAAKRGLSQMSAQAVGGAVGHNPISVILPCHRVVGSCGQLTGYAGGIEKKAALLTLEGLSIRDGIVR